MDTTNKKPISKRIYSQKTIEYMLYGCVLIGIFISIIANHQQSKNNNEHKANNNKNKFGFQHRL